MAYEVNGVRILGCGGIGGNIIPWVLRYFTYTHSQDEPLDITLVDGDKYETKNLERQQCSEGDVDKNKAQAEYDRLSKTFNMLDINVFAEYLTSDNIGSVIHDGDIVLMGFDNHKSRKLVADYCAALPNITLISGGNEWVDGNVQLFIRRNGKNITANLGDYHPEIAEPKDKSPAEVGCAEAMVANPQLIGMNATVAAFMFNAMLLVVRKDEDEDFKNIEEYGEVYIDIAKGSAMALKRNPLEA